MIVMASLLDAVAEPVDGVAGTTDTAVLIRTGDGEILNVGVEVGRTAREYLRPFQSAGQKVVGVRHRGQEEMLE